MRRLLSSPLIRYNYLKDFKKPVVEIPTSKPPKYIYKAQYHPDSIPDMDMGFKDHHHNNQWLDVVYGEQDKYQFQYSGQWWEAMSVPGRLLVLFGFLYITVQFHQNAMWRKQKHLPGVASHYNGTDVATSHMPTIIQH